MFRGNATNPFTPGEQRLTQLLGRALRQAFFVIIVVLIIIIVVLDVEDPNQVMLGHRTHSVSALLLVCRLQGGLRTHCVFALLLVCRLRGDFAPTVFLHCFLSVFTTCDGVVCCRRSRTAHWASWRGSCRSSWRRQRSAASMAPSSLPPGNHSSVHCACANNTWLARGSYSGLFPDGARGPLI